MKGIVLGDKNKEELKHYILNPLDSGTKDPTNLENLHAMSAIKFVRFLAYLIGYEK
ncbi:hypothetical protein [Helicobacter felis]|uniref:hypothetical protein n=1 Tax=Helicobacter felis TaxID=214 RepID=UPI001315A516|nr:hypothetical protein [Helicobacter felis]